MMEYKKLDERVFVAKSRGAYFIINTYPFLTLLIDGADSFENVSSYYFNNIKNSGILPYSDDYDFKGFFAMEWIMTSDCNLNCPHCFAHNKGEKGRYGLGEKNALSFSDLKDAIDKSLIQLQDDIVNNSLESAEYQLFIIGGEPLLEFPLLKQAITYLENELDCLKEKLSLKSINNTYFLATNGLLIDEKIAQYLSSHPFQVSVSIDTPVNPLKLDAKKTRKTEIAFKAVNCLISHGMRNVILNCVIPAEKVYELDNIMFYIESLGVMNRISGVQISPLTPPTRQTMFSGCSNCETIISEWGKDLDRCRFFAKKLIEYSDKYNTDMKKYHARVKHMIHSGGMAYRCPVGLWKWCLMPGGDIYPCHQFAGIEKYKMGNVHMEQNAFIQANKRMLDQLKDRLVFNVEPCNECPLQTCCCVFIDCPGRALLEGGSMYRVPEHQCLMAKEYLLTILEKALWNELG